MPWTVMTTAGHARHARTIQMSGGEPPFTQPPASSGRSAFPQGTGPASPATLIRCIRWRDEAILGTGDGHGDLRG